MGPLSGVCRQRPETIGQCGGVPIKKDAKVGRRTFALNESISKLLTNST
jgi:hypothetical protein